MAATPTSSEGSPGREFIRRTFLKLMAAAAAGTALAPAFGGTALADQAPGSLLGT